MSDNLTVYTDVTSPTRSTVHSLQQILSYGSYEDMDRYKTDASLIEILRDAGYKTFWLDNQGEYDKGDFSPIAYRVVARMCHYFYVIPKISNDEELLPHLDSCLKDTARNKVIFLHLYGSHFPYTLNAPESFRIFSEHDTVGLISPFKSRLCSEDLASINMYDNSIYHNDYFIGRILSRLQDEQGVAALLYFPDHGEEMCETYEFCGRDPAQPTRSQYDIPLILWRNDEHKRVVELSIDVNRPFCTDDAIHSIMDMTGVHHEGKDTVKSLFSPLFAPKMRMVEEKINYDSLPMFTNSY